MLSPLKLGWAPRPAESGPEPSLAATDFDEQWMIEELRDLIAQAKKCRPGEECPECRTLAGVRGWLIRRWS